MSETPPSAHFVFDEQNKRFLCTGSWSTIYLHDALTQFMQGPLPSSQSLTISGESLTTFDCAGALTLMECIRALQTKQNKVNLIHFTDQQRQLFDLVENKRETMDYLPPLPEKTTLFHFLGKETIFKFKQIEGLIILIGSLSVKIFQACKQPRRFHASSIIANLYSCGIQALPIVALLSFLIGIVLAYQMGLQLENYGANNFIAYLSAMAIFREFAPLITAIIIAGRTSSAFTAQIGSMKINEELDAISTMGLSPVELLVIPKVMGLLIVFPLLIFWSDVFSTWGAMMMSKFMLNVGYLDYLQRVQAAVGLKQMLLGLYKAPAFAILIALVGCFQGFRVESNADSVGKQTTKSVVQALFLIIIADAFFSVLYGWLGL